MVCDAGRRQEGPAERENDLVPYWIYPIEGGARIETICAIASTDAETDSLSTRCVGHWRFTGWYLVSQGRMTWSVPDKACPEGRLDELVGRLKINLSP